MNNRRSRTLLVIALSLAVLAACGTQPAPEPVTTGPPITTVPPTTVTPQPEIAQPTFPKGPVQVLDTETLTRGGLSIQQMFVCDAETVLFFVSPISGDGTISENLLVYSYSFTLGGFRPASFTAGVISLYPTCLLEDGTVTLVTLDSESYAPDSLIYLNPVTLEAVRAPLPQDDFYDLHISPNRRYAAITTYDYLRITDTSYQTEYWRMDRTEVQLLPQSEDEPFWDEQLPAATGWSADSVALSYKVVSWAEDCAPGLVDTAGWRSIVSQELAGCSLTPIGSGIYTYCGIYNDLPAGLYDAAGGLHPAATDFLAAGDALTAVAGHPSGVLCLLTLEPRAGVSTAYVTDVASGALLGTLSGAGEGLTFEQAAFVPDGSRLVLLARPVGGGARRVLTWDYRES